MMPTLKNILDCITFFAKDNINRINDEIDILKLGECENEIIRIRFKEPYSCEHSISIPHVHGHWYEDRWTRYDGCVVCSACKKRNNEHKFCPECGAKMDEGGEQDD